MKFLEDSLYHIYNRGNNKQTIFFERENYFFFLEKVKKYLVPNADLLAWCLMPNHFHFLIHASAATCRLVKELPIEVNAFSEGIRLLLSSYIKAIQRQQGYCGNLFQQKTKSKCLNEGTEKYGETAFHYIHQNPLRAGLVQRVEDWEFSSFRDYAGLRNDGFCNRDLALQLFDLENKNFGEISYQMIPEEYQKKIYVRV